ncbi:hypothetical protein J2129_000776 [Methanofollis sp. W23]|nr:hypothetical protein [Methanofollis sp. W23]
MASTGYGEFKLSYKPEERIVRIIFMVIRHEPCGSGIGKKIVGLLGCALICALSRARHYIGTPLNRHSQTPTPHDIVEDGDTPLMVVSSAIHLPSPGGPGATPRRKEEGGDNVCVYKELARVSAELISRIIFMAIPHHSI